MASYISPPKNVEIFNEDYVLRLAIENLHYYGDIVSHELFLLRKGTDAKKKRPRPDEEALSVIVEKLIENQVYGRNY